MTKQEILETMTNLDALEIEECLDLFLENINQIEREEKVDLLDALGRVTAEDVRSGINVPPFPKSAMDGYAVCARDVQDASRETPITLKVKGELCAGDYEEYTYEPGTAIRVMTGAYVPAGYDAVIRQEDTDYGENTVEIYADTKPYNNYCKAGEDMAIDEVIIPAGTRLEPSHMGPLASIGLGKITVKGNVRVGIISTGSELISPGEALQNGKIYNSISYMLAATIKKQGLEVEYMEICPDREDVLKDRLDKALRGCDIIITTGGVSVGKRDIVPDVLEAMGADILFRRANIQPGTPTTGSILKGKPVLSLSGNPYAALANFEVYFWDIAGAMLGTTALRAKVDRAVLQSEYEKINHSRRLIRAYAEDGNVYLPTNTHAASVINNVQMCNCMIDLEAERKVSVGDTVTIRYIL